MDGSLLFSVFVFLAAACVLVPLSKLSGLGSVIGYLIAGVLIGPHVLGLITEPETILHFSEFGVVMMLFLIGLELRPQALWQMRGKLLGLGGLQVGLTTAAFTGIGVALGLSLPEAITVAMALALSSTAIALQMMQDRGDMVTPTGKSGFAVLLFQDIIVIAMIAVLPILGVMAGFEPVSSYDSHGAESHGPTGVFRLLAIFGVLIGMVVAGRLLLRPIFRLIARSRVRETFTAIALLLVIGSALLMGWLGLSAALGAFIAGVVLADSEYRHQLERDIEPFKALLLGLFFISVGMSLDFITLAQTPDLIFGLVVGLLLIKFLILFSIGTVFKLRGGDRFLFAVLLCQAGEFGFVLFQFALTEGAVRPEIASRLNAVIALTMALTPLLVLAYDKLIAPRFDREARTGEAPEDQHDPVLILGYGRVGQIAGRLLQTQEIGTTIIDNNGDHIEFLKQFGHKVYYGDASDMDILRLAGAKTAKVIIVAMDDTQAVTRTVREVREHYPQAKIIARAFGRPHLFELLAEDADFVERETIRGGLAIGRKALEFMGESEARAARLADDFLAFDFKLARETYEMREDMGALAEHAATARELLKETLNADKSNASKS
ncbi:monovalent cation:proton antiporter-2 (CPA2) family protein [Litorimonas sp. RW-G-Af-16]|uniref:monovalent cation:proton antiporter-2 (CPA2) family protein n=1 Tax=Litorimonas sp. RW-G-Af-16 TaxID=3241168 RepID=UPI00390C4B30